MFAAGIPFSLVLLSHQRYDVSLINQKKKEPDNRNLLILSSLIYGLD